MSVTMSRQQWAQILDSVMSPLYIAATFVLTGIASISVLGISMSDSLVSASGSEISIALVIAVGVVTAAYLLNESVDWSEWDSLEMALVGAMLVLNIGIGLVPIVRDAVTGSQWIGIAVVVLNGGAYYLVAYWKGN